MTADDTGSHHERVVHLPINGTGLCRLAPDDDVIAGTEAFSSSKIGFSVRSESAHAVDAALLENNHFRPRTHQSIGEQNIAGAKDRPHGAKHSRLTLAFAGVAADTQIKHGARGERKESRDAR